MKYYLPALLLLIMATGARTMFHAAYNGMAVEHEFAPNAATSFYMIFSLWYVLLMIVDIILMRNKDLKGRNIYVALLSVAVFAPIIYMLVSKQ